MPTHDCAHAGHAAVNAMREAAGSGPQLRADLTEEDLADTIADVLHLARELGLEPDEVLEHGRSYYEGDLEDRAREPSDVPAMLGVVPGD